MLMLAGVVILIGLTAYFYRVRRKDHWKQSPFQSKRQRKREPLATPPDGALYSIRPRPMGTPIERLGYENAPDIELCIKRKRWWDRLFTAIGISAACRTANPDFDRTFHLVTDAAPVCQAMSMCPRTQQMMLDLKALSESTGALFRQVVLRRGQIWIEVAAKKRKKALPALVLAETFVPALRELSIIMEAEMPQTARNVTDHATPKVALIVSICGAMFFAGFLLPLRQIFFPQPAPLDIWPLIEAAFLTGLIVFGLLVVLTVVWLGRTSRTHTVLLELLVTGLIGAGLTSYSLLREANMAFDFSPSERHVVEVREKVVSDGRLSNYYLYLDPWHEWHESQNCVRFNVSSTLFEAVREGFPLVVEEHPGALGIGWVRLIPPRFRHVEESTASTSLGPTP